MSKDNETYSLPVGPNDLCFDKNEFIKKSFSVDQFLQNHRKKANLETLRDDLGIYLKVLRSSMIELINKDYADFVNLSSNLIGLDKAINGIQVPLGQLKEELLQVKLNLDEAMENLSSHLDQRRKIRARKRSLQSLARVQSSLSKWSVLLHLDEDGKGEEKEVGRKQERLHLDPSLVERAASEFNQLQFCISKCENDLAESHKQHAERIRDLLTSSLDEMFLESLQKRDSEGMARCLRIYITLDKIADVESLFRREVVSPALHDVVSESSLHSDPRGLQGVYSRILSFVDTNMEPLLKLTARGVRMPVVKGFDFLVNSFWPEVEERLELHLPLIYAPGNPEMFYQRYCETQEFLEKLERYCGTQVGVKRLHAHPQYVAFLQHWNLPVYFQIRFQEIAGALETVMNEGIYRVLPAPADFQLQITATAWDCLMRCWANGVFLHQLTHRFWKLNLQILARYYTWIGEALEQKWPSENLAPNTVSSDMSCLAKLQFLVHLYTDVEKLVAKLPDLLDSVTLRLGTLSQQGQELLKSCLKESEQQLLTRLPLITQFILGEISSQSLKHLRQVSDIPRLFRRTNREMPTKPCSYVAQVVALPLAFHSAQKSVVKSELLEQWLTLTFSVITQQFFSCVDDVLTSVQKTEESLRRLKKIRDRSAATSSSEAKGVGDDDKIRQQLLLDVYSFCEGVENVGIARPSVDKLEELVLLVETARTRNDLSK